MKSAVTLAVLASAVYAQLEDLPTCANDCFSGLLLSNTGCGSDVGCLCKQADALFQDMNECVLTACSARDQGKVFTAITNLCAEYGVDTTLGSATGGADSSVGDVTSHTGFDHGSTGSTGSTDSAGSTDSTGSTDSAGASEGGASLGDATSHTGIDHGSTGSTDTTGSSDAGSESDASIGDATSETTFEHGSDSGSHGSHGSTGTDAEDEDPEGGAWLGEATSETTFEHGAGHGEAPAASHAPSASSGGNKTSPPTATPPSPTKPPAFTGEGVRTAVSGVAALAAVVLALATL